MLAGQIRHAHTLPTLPVVASKSGSVVHTYRRVSYAQDRHMFHCLVRDGLSFLVMSEEVKKVLQSQLEVVMRKQRLHCNDRG